MWCVLVSMCAFRSVFSASALCSDKFDILGRIARTECKDAAPCECCSVICLSVSVCLSVCLSVCSSVGHNTEPYKKERDDVWVVHLGGPSDLNHVC